MEEGAALAKRLGVPFLETSAKAPVNVEKVGDCRAAAHTGLPFCTACSSSDRVLCVLLCDAQAFTMLATAAYAKKVSLGGSRSGGGGGGVALDGGRGGGKKGCAC